MERAQGGNWTSSIASQHTSSKQFGDYDRTFIEWYGKPFVDFMEQHPDVVTAYNQLKSNLAEAEDTIKQRNANRPYPYRYLQPPEMINSISI
jgi:hypothetical protein